MRLHRLFYSRGGGVDFCDLPLFVATTVVIFGTSFSVS